MKERKPLTKREIFGKIADFSENFPKYHEPPEKHYVYGVRFKEFIARLKNQIGLSDEIEHHKDAVFQLSYTCPGYPKHNSSFDENTNIYGQRYMGIRCFVLPLVKKHVEEYFDERRDSDGTDKLPEDQLFEIKFRMPKPEDEWARYSAYKAEVEVYLARIKSSIGEELYKELTLILKNIFSEHYFFPEWGLPDEWHGGRLGYKEKRPLTSDELKRHRIKGLEEFFAVADVKLASVSKNHTQPISPIALHDDAQSKQPLLKMHLDDYGRVFVNNELIATPVSGGDTDVLMRKLLVDQKNELDSKDISDVKGKGKRTIPKIITDLGFIGPVRALFFPAISDKKLVFRRELYLKDLEKAKITVEHVMKELSQSKKIERSRKESK